MVLKWKWELAVGDDELDEGDSLETATTRRQRLSEVAGGARRPGEVTRIGLEKDRACETEHVSNRPVYREPGTGEIAGTGKRLGTLLW